MITAMKLERWFELNKKRQELEREARALEKEKDLLSVEFEADLIAADKDSLVRGKYRVALIDGRPTVAWKDEFVRGLGAEAANLLVQSAPVKKRVVVVAIG